MRNTSLLLLVVGLVALFGLLAISPSAVRSQASGGAEIAITDEGFAPASVTIVAGESVHWTDESSDFHSVTTDSGLFDSGSLQAGAGFSIALAIPGVHTYYSTTNPAFQGQIHVVLDALPGPPDELASDNIPDITFPLSSPDDKSIHPGFGFLVSRTRIILGFVDRATVAQANAAMQAANVVIVGGLPDTATLLVLAPDTADFSGLTAALDSLRSSPAVNFAAMSPEMETAEVPAPAESLTFNAPHNWTWDASGGGNWTLEASRLPQAWNLREAIQRLGHIESVSTAVIDSGFEDHPDMPAAGPNRVVEVLCKTLPTGPKCTKNEPGSHGQLVSGIIAAVYDNPSTTEANRSLGLSGVNPVARVSAIVNEYQGSGVDYADIQEIVELTLNQVSNLRVVNMSFRKHPGNMAQWYAAHGTAATCGPDDNDDGTPGANQFCTPNNTDKWLKELENWGKRARALAEFASQKNIVLVQAGGNESFTYCIPPDHPDTANCPTELIKAHKVADFAWASDNWEHPALENPIVIAEAIGPDFKRSIYSQIEGDLSAPADNFAKIALGKTYGVQGGGGTSSAAPHIAGIIGYMLAFEPSLTVDRLKDHLLNWARFEATLSASNASHRADAYAAIMSIPGAAKAMVDVNDLSRDGNRRVIYGPPTSASPIGVELGLDTTSSTEFDSERNTFYRTHPDGTIDMRDFRRWRDAWLQVCLDTLTPGEGDCLEIDSVSLDGPGDHPKFDLNFDKCVNQGPGDAGCPTPENVFPRFDFNGDGKISRFEDAAVPLKADGAPASGQAEETMMTDLDVLVSQWDPDLDKTEGYTGSDLYDLVNSGDIEIHLQDLFAEGAAEAEIEITRTDTNEVLPIRTVPAGERIIYTVPAGAPIKIKASALVGGELVETLSQPLMINSAGFDMRLHLCIRKLDLTAFPPSLTANGLDEAQIFASLQVCDTDSLDGAVIDFSQTPTGTGHGTVKFSSVGVDPNTGKATNVFTAGTEIAEYEITGVVTFPSGNQVEEKVKINTTGPIMIAYRFWQTIFDFQEQGTSDWSSVIPTPDPFMADCDDDWATCVDFFEFELFDSNGFEEGKARLKREGVIKQSGESAALDEFITQSLISGNWAFHLREFSSGGTFDANGEVAYSVPVDHWERYKDFALPTARIETLPDGVRLDGLSEVAELEYPYGPDFFLSFLAISSEPPRTFDPPTQGFSFDFFFGGAVMASGTHPPELMFVPRGDGSALKHSSEDSDSLAFSMNSDGEFETYQFCQFVTSNIVTEPSYSSFLVPDFVGFARLWPRNTTYASDSFLHEYPMPVGPRNSIVMYSFIAKPITSMDELVNFPDPPTSCTEFQEPIVQFDAIPNPSDEGGAVKFTDTTVSAGNSIVSREWDFGDGETSTEQNPTHFYKDNGDYFVTLMITDATGEIGVASRTIVVDNVAPDVQVGDALANEGEDVTLTVLLADPGELDQAALDLHLQIGGGVPDINETRPAGIHSFIVSGLTAGDYSVNLTVTDKDGGVGTDDALIQVFGSGQTPPPPQPPAPPTPTCDPSVTLDAEEQAFLNLLNAYRVQSGVVPLEASPGLTKAAVRHALDMAANGFLEHIGSDNSTPQQRAIEEGYPSDDVSENIASGLSQADQVLFGWKSSPSHNLNMLNPLWSAIGISREQGSVAYWATSFGEILDCPTASAASSEGAETLLASAANQSRGAVSENAMVLPYGDERGSDSTPRSVARWLTKLAVPPVEPPAILAQLIPLLFPPVPALVISNVNPEAGQDVAFRNLSRDDAGQPIAAVLDPGDGTGPFNLGAGSFHQHTYASGGAFTVGLTATDSVGASLTVERQIDVTEPPPPPPDFNLTLSPDTNVMAPGTSVSFLVSLASINGFSSPVALSVESLPSGVTALFTPPTVTPSGTSILQIFAASNAQIGQFTLDVTASGGGITHTTSSSVTVNFGLVPVCFGAFEGTVTDIETGLPLQGANTAFGLGEILTDASGHYVIPKVNLNPDGSARAYTIQARLAGYWTANKGGTAICGVVTTVNIQMMKINFASMSGFVFEGVPDPNDHSANRAVTPTDIPIEGVSVGLSSSDNWQTDATGFYESPPIFPGTNNTPLGRIPHAIKNDFWGNTSSVTINAGQHLDKNFFIVPKCYVTITVNVTFGDTGLPASAVQLRLAVSGGSIIRFTDESGQHTFEHLELGFNNSSVSRSLSVLTQFEDYHPLHPTFNPLPVPLFDCDSHPVVNLVFQPRVPNFSTVQGHVFDADTGLPLPDMDIGVTQGPPIFFTKFGKTGAGGAYTVDEVFVGYDNQTSSSSTVTAFHEDYWGDSEAVTLQANQTHTVDITILKKRFGFIEGTVRDAVTHEPIEGAGVSLIGALPTDANGHFMSGPLQLQPGNQPATGYNFTASAAGYWNKRVFGITVRADETTIVDVDLLPVCEGATIVGTVINAATGLPIEGVKIDIPSVPDAFTDVDGNFAVTGVKVGTDNSPIQVSVQASKVGFNPQTKIVTIFCNASIVVNFGEVNTAVGTIQGTVTDATTGQLMQGVFIGSEFGGSATTSAQGQYTLSNVPLGPNNANREWDVTALPSIASGFDPQTKPVTAIANQVSILNFEFSADPNEPPTLDPIGNQTLDEGATLDVQVSASDPDGDPITLSAFGLPPFAIFTDNGDGTGVLSLSPDFDDAGAYPGVQITASDGDLSDGETFTITVNNLNRPPVADAGGPYSVNEGEPITLDGGASSDPDGDSLTYEWDLDNDGEFDDATGAQPSHTFNDDGAYSVGLRVSDGSLSDTATAVVTVNDLGPTAAFDWSPKPQLEGAAVAFTDLSASSPDAIASWDWDFAGLGGGNDQHPAFAFPDDGGYTVTLAVTDEDGSTDTIAQTVTIANAPPAVDAGPDQSVMQGDEVSFSGAFSDPGQDTHTIEWEFGDGNTASGTLTPAHVFDQPGIYTVALAVTEDDGSVVVDTLQVEVKSIAVSIEADLSVSKSASPDPATSGKPLAYTIIVENHGPSDATGVFVTDALPVGVAYDASQSSQQCAEAGAMVVCNLGDLAADASIELVIAVNLPVTTVGTLVNTASVSANQFDPDQTNNEATAQVEATLPEIALMNGALELIGLQTSYNPSDDRAPAGVFRIIAAWRNISSASFFDMHAQVVILTGNNLLLNADDGPGGVGAIASVPDAALGADGLLTPGETFTQTYEIGLAARGRFSFFINVFGRDP